MFRLSGLCFLSVLTQIRQTPFKREKQNNVKKLFNVLQLKQADKTVGKYSDTMQIDRLSYYSSISEKCECQQKSGTGWCEILEGRERHLFPLIIKEAVESCLEEIVLVSRHTAESHYPGEFQVSVWILSLPCCTQWNALSLMSSGFREAVTDYLFCQPQFYQLLRFLSFGLGIRNTGWKLMIFFFFFLYF